ncbi:gluconokinase [Rugamonas sp. FT82W]|uniref:Gluconokinase n=2 Tax=Duganella vulcania TaxID=2692166 RepID=A0A845GFV5_9BURK|nr:gluconokinase [Duganella vulcania]
MGVSGCGKSTVGQALAAGMAVPFIEGDRFHPPANVAKMSAGIALDDADRAGWLLALREQIELADGGLVLACSALKRKYRDQLRLADPALNFAHLSGGRALIASRMRERAGHYMPLSLLDSQLRDLEPLQVDEGGMVLDILAPPRVLVARILAGF